MKKNFSRLTASAGKESLQGRRSARLSEKMAFQVFFWGYPGFLNACGCFVVCIIGGTPAPHSVKRKSLCGKMQQKHPMANTKVLFLRKEEKHCHFHKIFCAVTTLLFYSQLAFSKLKSPPPLSKLRMTEIFLFFPLPRMTLLRNQILKSEIYNHTRGCFLSSLGFSHCTQQKRTASEFQHCILESRVKSSGFSLEARNSQPGEDLILA